MDHLTLSVWDRYPTIPIMDLHNTFKVITQMAYNLTLGLNSPFLRTEISPSAQLYPSEWNSSKLHIDVT